MVAALAGVSAAEDAVDLRRGGELRGTVKAANERFVVLAMASGEIRLPRSEVARIRRDVGETAGERRVVRRDEWFFLVEDEAVVGWARVLHSEQGGRIQVEERRFVFEGRRDRRRVEIATRDGRPLEYLWIESRPGAMEVWSGQIDDGRHVRQHRAEGAIETTTGDWPKGAVLPLCAWSVARLDGRTAKGALFDPRAGRARDGTASKAPVADWAGAVLATTEARVERAQAIHAPPDPGDVAREALLHPLTLRDKTRPVHHLPGGFTLTAPHERWVESARLAAAGDLLTLENRVTFARVEVSAAPLFDATLAPGALLDRSRTRLALDYDWFAPLGEATAEGNRARRRFEIRRGGERWQAFLQVEKRGDRVLTALALAPLRTWNLERPFLERILDSIDAVD